MVEYLRVFDHVGFFYWSDGVLTAAWPQRCFMGLLLLIILVLLLVGGLPTWGHSREWGYGPSGGLGFLLLILVLVIVFTDVIHFSHF